MKKLIILLGITLQAQTLIRPEQIKSWNQVSPNELGVNIRPGVRLSQININPLIISDWKFQVSQQFEFYLVFPTLISYFSGLGSGAPVWFSRSKLTNANPN